MKDGHSFKMDHLFLNLEAKLGWQIFSSFHAPFDVVSKLVRKQHRCWCYSHGGHDPPHVIASFEGST